ncbi:MAG: hypothetical protein U9R57_06620 [Thermodesulfobacteriota bacterium]|nr:hypothetical protein [Thermodesulfobacteriota bacterium]
MKKTLAVAAIVSSIGLAGSAMAVELAFHGDLNNRFNVYTNHAEFLVGDKFQKGGAIDVDDNRSDSWGEIKYRLWTEISSDDNSVKGVYAAEIGGLEFGKSGSVGKSVGGSYSGDGVNIETRWAYLDMQIPGVSDKMRMKTGLQPFNLNKYFWNETVMGVNLDGQTNNVGYFVGWERPYRVSARTGSSDVGDVDAFIGKVDFGVTDIGDVGFFASYLNNDAERLYDADSGAQVYNDLDARKWSIKSFKDDFDLEIYTFGLTGELEFGPVFVNTNLIYQTGSIDNAQYVNQDDVTSMANEYDLNSYFGQVDVGTRVGATKITGTYWYSSGDDDPTDDNVEAYLATDVDMTASMIIMEGMQTDDDYFTERPYILDKGMHLFKIAADTKVSDKLKVGGALLYMMTAEDITYIGAHGMAYSDDGVGTELNAYVKYNVYPDVVLSMNFGYLFTEDGMDYFESDLDGSADEDIYSLCAGLRFKF